MSIYFISWWMCPRALSNMTEEYLYVLFSSFSNLHLLFSCILNNIHKCTISLFEHILVEMVLNTMMLFHTFRSVFSLVFYLSFGSFLFVFNSLNYNQLLLFRFGLFSLFVVFFDNSFNPLH